MGAMSVPIARMGPHSHGCHVGSMRHRFLEDVACSRSSSTPAPTGATGMTSSGGTIGAT